jgi:hypothetical protein
VTRRTSRSPEFVFAYGSLVASGRHRPTREPHPSGFIAELEGYTRGWGVAMDNSVDLPGYKFYERPDGSRPSLFVAFLDLADDSAPDARVNGLCFPVDDRQLSFLDRRERNYVRRDVSDRVASPGGRVWTYLGSPDGRERLREGRRRGRAVIQAGYLRAVRTGFDRLGARELEACEGSLAPAGLLVAQLVRRELAAERTTRLVGESSS